MKCQNNIDDFIELANDYSIKLKKEGLILGYHNHSNEFLPNEDGSISFNQIIEKTNLTLEIDTFWAFVAGQNPVELIEQHKDRISFIHLKDGVSTGEEFPLGMGTAPALEVYQKSTQLGILIIVESETQKPDGFTEAKICMDFLRQLK